MASEFITIDDPVLRNNFRKFEAAMDEHLRVVQESTGDAIWKYSTIFANGLIASTQPAGQAGRAQKAGERAVKRDISRVYAKPSQIYKEIEARAGGEIADRFWAAVYDDDVATAQRIVRAYGGRFSGVELMTSFDDGRRHSQRRNPRGRVGRNRPDQGMTGGALSSFWSYLRKKVDNVGFTKAGWIGNFHPPGIARVARFVRRHAGRAPGRVEKELKKGDLRGLWFENRVPWIDRAFRWNGGDRAYGMVARAIMRDVSRKIKQDAKAKGASTT